MTCSHIEKKLALSEKLTAAESDHLNRCSTCSNFSKDIAVLKSTPKFETPAYLKSRTLQTSLQQFDAQPHLESKQSYFERLWQTPHAALILTAFSLLALVITILYQISCDRMDTFCQMSSIFLMIILAQNLIAALCMPLLIQHKNKLYYKW